MRIIILGKSWKLSFLKRLPKGFDKTCDGLCDSPDTKDKKIIIRKDLKDPHEMRLLIHEMLHAANFETYSEEYVDQLSNDIAMVLSKLGYKKGTS